MKTWVKKLLDQFAIDWGTSAHHDKAAMDINEERATLLYILDVYNKHLIEIDTVPMRKVRETFDGYAKSILQQNGEIDKVFFKLRQFFTSYRIDEYTYVQKTFDDFKKIIWDFADQLGEDIREAKVDDQAVGKSLESLREAVEANAIGDLRAKSKEFIDFYIKHQAQKDERRTKRMRAISRNLTSMKKKLVDANQTMRVDHLTSAFNRKSFDEMLSNYQRLFEIAQTPVSLLLIDIDHFKKVNDCYGHDIGDVVLKECVGLVKQIFTRDNDFVARIGGEEFAVILPEYEIMSAVKKAEETLQRIRREAIVTGKLEIRFTVSIGIAQLQEGESPEKWLKRADAALYAAKNSGRDRYTIAPRDTKNVA